MSDCDVFAVVPCYNEAASIGTTLRHLREVCPEIHIAAVNDGSEDDTLDRLEALNDVRLTILDLPCNSGIGTTVQTGLLFAERGGAGYAVKFDGDGQHLAEEIELLLKPLLDGEADLVIGSRFLKGNDGFRSTFCRRQGIRLLGWLCFLLTGRRITDTTSGFRAYNRRALEFAARYYPAFDYPEPEECVMFLRNGFRVKEVSCRMAERQGGQSSIRAWKTVYFMFKVGFAMIMAGIRRKRRVSR